MDAFSYLSVLLSIIIGLGITQLLAATGRLIRGRTVVRAYWPPLLWAGILLVIYVQMWWSMFGLRARTAWTFLAFFIVLLQTVVFYMATSLVLPENVTEPSDVGGPSSPADSATVCDLRAHYEQQVPWFFGFFAATVVVSMVKEELLDGQLPVGANLAFHLFLLAGCALAILVRRPRFHEGLAVANAAAIAVYIAALFSRLR
jgi:hypothetical protein